MLACSSITRLPIWLAASPRNIQPSRQRNTQGRLELPLHCFEEVSASHKGEAGHLWLQLEPSESLSHRDGVVVLQKPALKKVGNNALGGLVPRSTVSLDPNELYPEI